VYLSSAFPVSDDELAKLTAAVRRILH